MAIIIFISNKKKTEQINQKTWFDQSDRLGIGFWSEFFKTNIIIAIKVFILFRI
jgi:hypothetical protein